MVWTKEKKALDRKQKKQRTQEKLEILGEILLELAPSASALKRPLKTEHLGTHHDHGGHQKALNFPMNSNLKASGNLSIGLVYDGEWKEKSKIAGNGVKERCNKSDQHIDFLLIIEEALETILKGKLWKEAKVKWDGLAVLVRKSMRVSVLVGARTLAHTDSYRGNTPNFLYIVKKADDPQGCLVYDTFPKFKSSVVSIHGKLYVPHSYSEASNEVRCIGSDPQNSKKPTFYVFNCDVIDAMLPYGDLPYGIVGWKVNGKIQVIPFREEQKLYSSPFNFHEVSWDDLISTASQKCNQVHKKPRRRIVDLDKYNEWQIFMAWQYRHWWVGNNMLMRFHAFFRTMRQASPSSNVIRKGTRINYVDATTDEWKTYSRKKGSWESIKRDQDDLPDTTEEYFQESSWDYLNQKESEDYESFGLI